MKKGILTEFTLYRYRYILGYALFILALIDLLFVAGIFVPGALTTKEMQSAVASANLPVTNILNMPVVDLPYHILQKFSLFVFGLSPLAIKLPSLIIGLATGVAFMFLLRRWFAHNVAILTAIVAVTASQFLILSQSGTPTIMLLFWPTFMLLAATHVSAETRFKFYWKLLFFAFGALSLYTPLSFYMLVIMIVATILHPHLRFMVRRLSPLRLSICTGIALLLLAPLAIHIFQSPRTIIALLGVPDVAITPALLWENLKTMAHIFVGFTAPQIGPELLFPIYGLSTAALILLGIMRLIADHHSARTYTIGLWSIVMAFVLMMQPLEYLAIAFIPMLLMLAIGIETLIREWYDLFPLNPYARLAALVPLVILLGGIVYSGIDRYTDSYRYSPAVAQYFSTDLSLATKTLSSATGQKTLVVTPEEKPFYELLRRRDKQLVVANVPSPHNVNIVASRMTGAIRTLGVPDAVVTNAYENDNLRFLVYKNR